jgi:hypothetical protein
MRPCAVVSAFIALLSSAALAAPLLPHIESHNFHFGAWEPLATPFYDSRGAEPDHLMLAGDDLDREVTAFWEIWPGGDPLPIYNAQDALGGDFQLYLQFDGEDAVPPYIDVSITGTGLNEGEDLFIWGKMPDLGITDYEMLIAIDVQLASLYGFGGQQSFALETAGVFTFVNPLLPGADELIGQSAVSRGNIDYLQLALPSGYDPLVDYGLPADGGGYSGEAGRGYPTPEPACLLTLLVGVGMMLRRR